MELNELSKLAHKTAVEKGFYDRKRPVIELVALAITELAEAIEADRKDNWENFKEEIADTYIRLGDMCAYFGINIEDEIIKKMEFNKTRPKKHGKKY